MRHRHPHIARQRERTVAQQMHILAHVRITGLDGYIFVHQKTHSYPRLDRRIHLAADTVHTEPCAVVQPEPSDSTTKSGEPEEKKNKKRAKPIEMLIKGWTSAVDYLTTVEDKQL